MHALRVTRIFDRMITATERIMLGGAYVDNAGQLADVFGVSGHPTDENAVIVAIAYRKNNRMLSMHMDVFRKRWTYVPARNR